MSEVVLSYVLPHCEYAHGEQPPCTKNTATLAGLVKACPACERVLPRVRLMGGWARQMTSAYYLSDGLPEAERAAVIAVIRSEIRARRKPKTGQAQPMARSARLALHELQRLVLSAQSTLSVEDYGDALAGAQRIISALIDAVDGSTTISGEEASAVEKKPEFENKSSGGGVGSPPPEAMNSLVVSMMEIERRLAQAYGSICLAGRTADSAPSIHLEVAKSCIKVVAAMLQIDLKALEEQPS